MKMEKYRELVEDFYGIDLGLKCRQTIYIEARALYYYLCRNLGRYSLNKIAQSLDKNHATVMHALAELPYMRKFNSKRWITSYFISSNCREKISRIS